MATLTEINLLLRSTHSQKCCASVALMEELGAKPGDVVEIVLQNGNSFIVKMWPRTELETTVLHVETQVSKNTGLRENGFHKIPIANIHTLLPKPAKTLRVTLVLEKLSQVIDLKQQQDQTKLNQILYNILRHSKVSCGYAVKCGSSLYAKMFGVSDILIHGASNPASCYTVSKSTKFVIEEIMSQEKNEQRWNFKQLPRLGGLSRQLRMLSDIFKMNFTQHKQAHSLGIKIPRTVLLRGPSGCGKTTLVKHAAKGTNAHLVAASMQEVFGSRPGESEENLRDFFHKAQLLSKEGPSVLFFDELDVLSSGKDKGTVEGRVVAQLASLLDELTDGTYPDLVVAAATSHPHAIDPVLRRSGRFDKEIFVGIPRIEERLDILRQMTLHLVLDADVCLETLAEATPGFVGADLCSLVDQAVHLSLSQLSCQIPEKLVISSRHFDQALHSIIPSSQRNSDILVDSKKIAWEDIGGLDNVKSQIKQSVEWPLRHPDAFSRLGVPRPRGVLLYGPPGCAKTTLVRAAASACHVTFLAVSSAQLYSPFVGDSERKIAEVFQQARAGAPSILFLDEIDALVGHRSKNGHSGSSSVQERVLSTFLNQMDGIGVKLDEKSQEKELEGEDRPQQAGGSTFVDNRDVLVVAATNRPDMLDDALIRPGRLDRLIYVPPPDHQARLEILKIHRRKSCFSVDVDLDGIAEKTEGFTGADLENLCREAALLALTYEGLTAEKIEQRHFDDALQKMSPSITPEQVLSYSKMKVHGR